MLTDTEKAFPGSRIIFDSGPEGVELWDAIDGSYESLWRIIDPVNKDMKKYRKMRATHRTRVEAIINTLLPSKDNMSFSLISQVDRREVNEIHGLYMLSTENWYPPTSSIKSRRDSHIFEAYRSGELKLELGLSTLAAFIAMWRLSMLIVECVDEMNYVMNGLLIKAIPDMLEPYGVADMVVATLKQKQDGYLSWIDVGHGKVD